MPINRVVIVNYKGSLAESSILRVSSAPVQSSALVGCRSIAYYVITCGSVAELSHMSIIVNVGWKMGIVKIG